MVAKSVTLIERVRAADLEGRNLRCRSRIREAPAGGCPGGVIVLTEVSRDEVMAS